MTMLLSEFLKKNKPLSTKKGSFTKAYLYDDKVILSSVDSVKECMAHGWFPDSDLFPDVKFSALDVPDYDDSRVYESPRYIQARSLKSILDAENYALYMTLRDMWQSMTWDYKNAYNWQDDFHSAVNDASLSDSVKESLTEAYDALLSYSHKVRFEISPRNVAATKDGKLILLDCFFIRN